MSSKANKRFWEDLTSFDFANMNAENHLIVLPVAAVEQHGPHLPVGVDAKILDGIIELVCKELPNESNAIFLPTLRIGKSNEHLEYSGTLSLSMETLYSTLLDIGSSVYSSGFKKFAFLNSHGGNISILDIAAREFRVRHKLLVFNINWFGLGMPESVYSEKELRHGIHAGDLETSLMLALEPENVKMELAQNFIPQTVQLEKSYKHIGLTSGAKIGWQAQDLNAYGACGNASIANAKKGELTLDFVCKRLLETIKEIEEMTLAFVSDETRK